MNPIYALSMLFMLCHVSVALYCVFSKYILTCFYGTINSIKSAVNYV